MTVRDSTTTQDTATFYRHEIEALINKALAARDPLVMRSLRWVRWSKRVAASEVALDHFHGLAAGALARFDRGEKSSG